MRLKATLIEKKEKDLNLLVFDYKGLEIKALILELNLDLKIGEEAIVFVNPMLLSLSNEKVDAENVYEVEIKSIEKGEILAKIECDLKGSKVEVFMLNERANFNKKAYLYFKSNFVAVER